MGDLSELMASIAEKGIIEPLVVRQRGDRYQIIAGERRYHAAVQVGLREVPVVIREVDDTEVMELALVENLQRKDLTAFEEAEALLQLARSCGYTHEDLARKLGKSRTSITESLSLAAMPEEVRNLCRLADITVQVDAAADRQAGRSEEDAGPRREGRPGRRHDAEGSARRDRQAARPDGPKAFVFAFRPPDQGVQPASQLHQGRASTSPRSSTRSKASSRAQAPSAAGAGQRSQAPGRRRQLHRTSRCACIPPQDWRAAAPEKAQPLDGVSAAGPGARSASVSRLICQHNVSYATLRDWQERGVRAGLPGLLRPARTGAPAPVPGTRRLDGQRGLVDVSSTVSAERHDEHQLGVLRRRPSALEAGSATRRPASDGGLDVAPRGFEPRAVWRSAA